MELAQGAVWVWKADTVHHGTTVGRLPCMDPKSWKTRVKQKMLKDIGQTVMVQVISAKLASAGQRSKISSDQF